MPAYYNENHPPAVQHLRNLMAAGLIAPGDIDSRSIEDVVPTDVLAYDQVHLFAGQGGWPLALRLAGIPDDYPVWTGSCPCQPFSQAGQGKGTADQRHLWPCMCWLVRQCRPRRVLGEQVARAIGFHWLAGIQADLEAEGYLLGPAVLGAHSVGAPHMRLRLYWGARLVADGVRDGREPRGDGPDPGNDRDESSADREGSGERLAHGDGERRDRLPVFLQPREPRRADAEASGGCGLGHWDAAVWWPCRDGKWRRVPARPVGNPPRDDQQRDALPRPHRQGLPPGRPGGDDGLPDAQGQRRERPAAPAQPTRVALPEPARAVLPPGTALAAEPRLFPLVDGLPGSVVVARPAGCPDSEETRRVSRSYALRAAGNAIVPQVAAVFAQEFLACAERAK